MNRSRLLQCFKLIYFSYILPIGVSMRKMFRAKVSKFLDISMVRCVIVYLPGDSRWKKLMIREVRFYR